MPKGLQATPPTASPVSLRRWGCSNLTTDTICNLHCAAEQSAAITLGVRHLLLLHMMNAELEWVWQLLRWFTWPYLEFNVYVNVFSAEGNLRYSCWACMPWSPAVLQAGQRGDLSAVLSVVESAGKYFDATAVEAALGQVSSTRSGRWVSLPQTRTASPPTRLPAACCCQHLSALPMHAQTRCILCCCVRAVLMAIASIEYNC